MEAWGHRAEKEAKGLPWELLAVCLLVLHFPYFCDDVSLQVIPKKQAEMFLKNTFKR